MAAGSRFDAVDVITDFSAAEGDRIDLAGSDGRYDGNGLTYRWNGALASPLSLGSLATGGGQGFVDAWTWISNGVTYLFVDLDDDQRLGSQDFLLAFEGAPTINLDSFRQGLFSVFYGTTGVDNWSGSINGDTYWGNNGNDILRGRAGNDVLHGEAGNDQLYGDEGDDTLVGGAGGDTLFGGAGNDTLWAALTNVTNTTDPDTGTTNAVYGEDGNDFLTGGRGSDLLDGGDGDDTLNGRNNIGSVVDTLLGGAGNDTLAVIGGTMDGGDGNDRLVFYGDLEMFTGTATNMTGGNGADTFVFTLPLGRGNASSLTFGRITDFNGGEGDQFDLTSFNRGLTRVILRGDIQNAGFSYQLGKAYSPATDYGSDFVQTWTWFDGTQTWLMIDLDKDGVVSSQDFVVKLDGHITLAASAFSEGSLYAFNGGTNSDDVWTGTSSNETYYGLGGNDQINGGGGIDDLYGGLGNDTIRMGAGGGLIYGGAGSDTIYGGAFADTLRGDGNGSADADWDPTSINIIYGGGGNDDIQGGGGTQDQLYGGTGNDNISGAGFLYGEDGNDSLGGSGVLDGGAGDDGLNASSASTLIGGSGNDYLRGSLFGNDVLRGGSGNDTLLGNGGVDVADYSDATSGVRVSLLITITSQDTGGAGRDYLDQIENLSGSSFDDVLIGNAQTNVLQGMDGNDVLLGGGGNDTINGGNGYDIAGYSGVRRAYVASATSVSGNGEGVDSLTGIEDLAFTDGRLTFARDGQAAQVMRLYDAAFNRAPDQSGFEALLDTLENGSLTLQQLANAFINSTEFQSQYAGLTNQQFVEQLYQFCLNRAGDSGGIATWTAALNGGMSRGEVLLAFSESGEHKDLLQGQLDQGLWVADEQTLQIARLYDATYDRLPDQGGLATWRNALGGGMSLLAIAQAFATAPEFQARYGSLSNQAFVELMYQLCLNRNGDAGGIQTWTDALNGGMSRGEVLMFFSESAEHVALTRSTWLGGVPCTDVAAPAPVLPDDKHDDAGAQVIPVSADPGADASHGGKDGGAQVLPGAETAHDGKDAGSDDGAQVIPMVADGADTGGKDAGPQVLPGVADAPADGKDGAAEDGGPLILPGVIDSVIDDGFLLAKADGDTGPQILPGAADDGADFLFDIGGDAVDAGHDLPGLEHRLAMLFIETGEHAPGLDTGADSGPMDLHHNPDPWAA